MSWPVCVCVCVHGWLYDCTDTVSISNFCIYPQQQTGLHQVLVTHAIGRYIWLKQPRTCE